MAPRLLDTRGIDGESSPHTRDDYGMGAGKKNVVVAAALTSVIMLIGFLHAPVMPVVGGAAIACAWTLWRASGG